MRFFKINEVCENSVVREKLIERFSKNENYLELEMPQWIYLNEFGDPELISWWDFMYQNHNLIPNEKFRIILD